MKKIKGLDALRAIAVLLVIREHWGPRGFNFSAVLTFVVTKILPSGTFAVNFFFVLSGFLITGILLKVKQAEEGYTKIQNFKIFAARRCLRIFPVYYIFLIFLFLINYPDVRHYSAYYATYATNFLVFGHSSWTSIGHTWSLSVEEQFYLLWPLIIIFIPNKTVPYVITSFVIIGSLTECVTKGLYGPFAMVLTINCFNAFALGGLYSYAMYNEKIRNKIKRVLLFLFPFSIVLYLLILFKFLDENNYPTRLINALISVNLIMYITENKYDKITGYVVECKWLNSLGRISYGIYLFHYVIPPLYYLALDFITIKLNLGQKVNSIFYIPVIAELLQFAFLITISYASYYFIEIKFLKLKKYFDYQTARN